MIHALMRCTLAISCLLVWAEEPAHAGNKFEVSEQQVFLEPNEEMAVLYLVNPSNWFFSGLSKKTAVYLDERPLGYLAAKSYMVSLIEPGVHALRSKRDRVFLDCKPGRTYVLFQDFYYGGSASSGQPGASGGYFWKVRPSDHLRETIESRGLRHATTTDEGLTALRQRALYKKYSKEAKKKQWLREMDESLIELPFEGEHIPCRLGEDGQILKRGDLTIDRERLIWQSKAHRIELSIDDIQEIEPPEAGSGLLIRYGPAEKLQTLVLYADWVPSYNRVLLHLLEATHSTPKRVGHWQ